MEFHKHDYTGKQMSCESDKKFSCVNCGRRKIIDYNQKHVLCDWCGHLIFRTEEEYFQYYDRQRFRKLLRRAMTDYEKQNFYCTNKN